MYVYVIILSYTINSRLGAGCQSMPFGTCERQGSLRKAADSYFSVEVKLRNLLQALCFCLCASTMEDKPRNTLQALWSISALK